MLQLKQLVAEIVAERLQPKDMTAALGLDGEGRLFMKLGATKTVGSAALDAAPEGSSAHVGDTFRYGLMSNPWVYRAKIERTTPEGFTFAEFRNKRRHWHRLRAY